jgi:periplasmic protein TonB
MKLLLVLAFVAFTGAQDSTIYTPGDGVSLPQVTKQVKAEYTPEAMQNRIEGMVGLDTVVLADGKVGDVKVTESLDAIYGLDRNAVAAMKQWEFKPGLKDGKAVAVRVHIQIAFTLK